MSNTVTSASPLRWKVAFLQAEFHRDSVLSRADPQERKRPKETAEVTFAVLDLSRTESSQVQPQMGLFLVVLQPRMGSLVAQQSRCWRPVLHPTPGVLPGEVHGQRSLVGSTSWGRSELNTTEPLTRSASHAKYPQLHIHSSLCLRRKD